MTTTQIIIVVVALAVAIIALAARGDRPRVTHITRTVRKEKEDEE